MGISRHTLAALLLIGVALSQDAPRALVDLDAASPSAGSARWENLGTLGAFRRIGRPVRTVVGGAPALRFNEGESRDAYQSEEPAPDILTGSEFSRSIEVWVHDDTRVPEETLVAWARRGGPEGTNLSFNLGTNPIFGAIGHWGAPDLGWKRDPPRARWTYLVLVAEPRRSQVFVDGALANERSYRPGTLRTHRGTPITIAAQLGADGEPEFGGLEGRFALGAVRVHGRLLSAEEIGSTFARERSRFPVPPAAPTLRGQPREDGVRAGSAEYRAHGEIRGEPRPTLEVQEPADAVVSVSDDGRFQVVVTLAGATDAFDVTLRATNSEGAVTVTWPVRVFDPAAIRVDEESLTYFRDEVHPLLERSCFPCHGGGDRIRGELVLTQRESALQGGSRGPLVNWNDPRASLLLEMISYRDEHHQMPPSAPLPLEDRQRLESWVLRGLPFDPTLERSPAAAKEGLDFSARMDHWSYRAPTRVPTPARADVPWVRSPIDAFVWDGLAARGSRPAPEADRAQLLRRLTYDLTGLPPTPEEMRAFGADRGEGALERVVDRLLASPHYGEKWGRHWLDLVRYGETNGYERDSDKPWIWRYRDYVIRAFNEDLPFDRFVLEQLAGDEIDTPTADSRIATGYFGLMIWDDEPGAGRLQGDYDVLADIVATTSEAFLGLTIGCARCHDHKKDPIPQSDYYSFMAFFHGLQSFSPDGNIRDVADESERADARVAAEQREREIARLHARVHALESNFRRDARSAGLSLEPFGDDLLELQYRFHRDTFAVLPVLSELKAETEGRLENGFIDLSPRSRDESIGFEFHGRLRVPANGAYAFTLRGTAGVRLSLNGAVVLETDTSERTVRVDLEAGLTSISCEWIHRGGAPILELSWEGPGVVRRSLVSPDRPEGTAQEFDRVFRAQAPKILGGAAVTEWKSLKAEIGRLRAVPTTVRPALCVKERGAAPPPLNIHIRGSAHALGRRVEPAFPTCLDATPPRTAQPRDGGKSSGRRRVLAEWMIRPDNPRLARVFVNRVWQHHFGRGLVPTPNDFGWLGDPPTHPELLDWLAQEFVAGGFRVKALHRAVLTSSAYRMDTVGAESAATSDPTNAAFSRFPLRRLTAEELRDSVLSITGSLNPTQFGESVYPPLPPEVLATSSRPDEVWGRSSPENRVRRSIYTKVKRSLIDPLLASHDLADTDNSCPVRFTTTVPTQALTLLNGKFMNEQATKLRERIQREAGPDPRSRIRRGLELVLQRPISTEEVERQLAFLSRIEDRQDSEDRAWDLLCLGWLNLNEMVYP